MNYLYTHDLGWQTHFTGQKGSAWASHVLSVSFRYYTFPITNIVLLELSSFVIELSTKVLQRDLGILEDPVGGKQLWYGGKNILELRELGLDSGSPLAG